MDLRHHIDPAIFQLFIIAPNPLFQSSRLSDLIKNRTKFLTNCQTSSTSEFSKNGAAICGILLHTLCYGYEGHL